MPTDAVLQPLGAHLGSGCTVAIDVVVVIDDVDQFISVTRPQVYHSRHGTRHAARRSPRSARPTWSHLRRTLHQWPEIGNDLPITRETVLGALDGLPLDVTLHETTSGIAALLDGGKPGPTVLLRGDMDALPLTEDTGLDFDSRSEGSMHACGHDTHTSMLVGAARLLSAQRADIAGRVLFMFQPGEEGNHGARFMLEEGLLDLPPRADGSESPVTGPSRCTSPSSLPTGWLSCRGGSIMAAADTMFITVKGRGGHASEPYRALDPIPIACEIVQALQTMITRRIDVFDPAVVTVGKIVAGTVNNIIPETAEIEGTIRAVSESTRRLVHDGIRRVAEGIAAAHDAEVAVELGRRLSGDGQRQAPKPTSCSDLASDAGRRRQGPASFRTRSWAPKTSATCCSRSRARWCSSAARRPTATWPPRRRTTPIASCSTKRRWSTGTAMYAAHGARPPQRLSWSVGTRLQRIATRRAARRRVTSSNGRSVNDTMPSLHSMPLCGSSNRLHRNAPPIGDGVRTVATTRSPHAS